METQKRVGADTYNCATCKSYNNAKENHNYVLNGFKKCIYLPYKDMSKVSEERVMINKLIYELECVWGNVGDDKRIAEAHLKNAWEGLRTLIENNDTMYGRYGNWRWCSRTSYRYKPSNVKDLVDPYDMNSITVGDQLLKDSLALYKHTLFTPFLCINISPDWKAVDLLLNTLWNDPEVEIEERHISMYARIMKALNHDFAECSKRFSHYNYAVECGKTGRHVHSHAVGQINPDMLATVITQKNKGNLSRSIRTLWKGVVRREVDTLHVNDCEDKIRTQICDCISKCLDSKYSIQINIIRKKEFLQDKLDYLVEELKPLDHKNKSRQGFPIIGDLELIRQH